MKRREFIKSAAIGSVCFGYEAANAFGINELAGIAANLAQAYMMGEKEEIKIGKSHYKSNIEKSGGLYDSEKIQEAISAFSKPLIATTERKNFDWEIVVLNNEDVNAWAMPGGKMAVNAGLIKHTKNQEELASVIAHEIGHVEKSHTLDQIQNQTFVQTLGSGAKSALASFGVKGMTAELLNSLEGPIYKMILSGYSRKHEFEADSHILYVFEKVGLDPEKADDFFITLDKLYPSDSTTTTSLFSTHPVTQDRIKAIESKAQNLKYKHKKADLEGWDILKERLG